MSPATASPPALEGALRRSFEGWLEAAFARHQAGLHTRELARGLRALSSLYVERRAEGELGRRAREGAAKRAALATYYAALHFLTTWHALRALELDLAGVRRIVDLGCGTGATGAALACACPGAPRLLGVDASGWALGEARRTWSAFGIPARSARRRLPEGLPVLRGGDLAVSGWFANELADRPRERLLAELGRARRRGAAILLFEPLARRVAPWWHDAVVGLGDGAEAHELHLACERPARIAQLDAASGLDHRVLGARLAFAAPHPNGPTRRPVSARRCRTGSARSSRRSGRGS